jgi:hypothetical protein
MLSPINKSKMDLLKKVNIKTGLVPYKSEIYVKGEIKLY